MGFLDHTTNNIIVDAVLTDEGRKKLASASGLNIRQYAFADTEVDYTLLKKYGEIVGKENAFFRTDLVTGSEDFSDMLKVVPGAYCNIAHGGSLPLHNDGFILDDGILPIGAPIYARLVEKRG